MMIKRAILFVTFGGSRPEVIEPILDRLISEGADRWTDRWIETVRGGENLWDALKQLNDDGFDEVSVQPLMINNGNEYEKIRQEVRRFVNHMIRVNPMRVKLGRPLLWDSADRERLAELICQKRGAVAYVAHGTGGSSDEAFRLLERVIWLKGREDITVTALKGRNGLEHLTGCLDDIGTRTVVLKPLMLTVGTHAVRDLAGDGETSWKTKLEARGYRVICEMTGLGEDSAVRAMFLDHAQEAQLIRRDYNPLEALILAGRTGETPLSQCSNNLGLDETKILACTNMRQALMIQELQNQELFPECELEIVEGAVEDVIAMIDGLGADDCGEIGAASEYTGLITSYSELTHLGLEHRVRTIFIPEEIVPAMGAGTVTEEEGAAMQAFMYEIQEPTEPDVEGQPGEDLITAVYVESSDDELELWGLYYDETTGQWWTHWKIDDPAEPEVAGREFAKEIRGAGQWADWESDEEDWDEE